MERSLLEQLHPMLHTGCSCHGLNTADTKSSYLTVNARCCITLGRQLSLAGWKHVSTAHGRLCKDVLVGANLQMYVTQQQKLDVTIIFKCIS